MFTASNIMKVEDLQHTCAEIQEYIERKYAADNPAAVVERANELEAYMALSGKMLADAKYRYDEVLNSVFIAAVKDGNEARMQTSTLNKYIDSLCKDYAYLVKWSERINAACTHQLDFSRTIISKLKEEMRAAQYQTSC